MIKINIPEKYVGTEIENKILEIAGNINKGVQGCFIVVPILPEDQEQFTVEVVDGN